MTRPQHTEDWLREFLKTARERFERAITAESENRSAALDDLRFKSGDQWYPEARAERMRDRRPCLTINKMKTFCHQVTNDLRQNRPAISVSPVGENANKHAANVLKGLIREIVRRSAGDIAFDTGVDGAVSNGFGYWRIITEYEDEDSFDQVISLLRVRNPFTVYLDPARQQPDGSDAMWAFVTEMIPRSEYERRWPKADKMAWDGSGLGDNYRSWLEEKSVRIAEYFEVVVTTKTLVHLANGFIGFKDDLTDELKQRISDEPDFVLKERESEQRKVTWYKITGKEILEEREWAGKWIPIIECVGDEIDIEGKVIKSGIIRDAKDPQRMKNYWNPICLSTPIATPYGWKTMGETREGDKVFDEQGKVCNVVGESPVFLHRECFKVTFDDGCQIVADKCHPWTVEERGKRKTDGVPLTTKTITTGELDPKRHFIKSAKPLELPEASLPVNPYFLGYWLGDGDSSSATITCGDADVDDVRGILSGLGCDVGRFRRYRERHGVFTVHGVSSQLRGMRLFGNKHIPQQYLRSSREQRLLLLQGLMDSDGSIQTGNMQCSFTTVFPKLAEGFAELLSSLGIKAVSIKRERGELMMPQGTMSVTQPFWQFSFCLGPNDDVFRLQRKRAIQNSTRRFYTKRTKRHNIVSVEPVPSVPVKCIAVDSASHLFLAGLSMIPTHNTAMTERVALETKAPWVVAEGQIEGHESEWRTANTKSHAYLSYKPTSVEGKLVPAPQRQAWGGPPAGVMAAEAGAEQDMMATTGIRFDATKSERIQDESGVALKQLNSNQQLGAFHYTDNFGRSLTHTGRVILDLVCPIYDTKRLLTIVNDDGTDEQVMIDPHATQAFDETEHNGRQIKCVNPLFGKYDVAVIIGPNYQTKMQEASEGMLTFGKNFPNAAPYIADLVAKNQPWPESDVIDKRLKRLLPPELLEPDAKNMTPEVQALVMSMKRQLQQLTQEKQQLQQELQSQDADRALQADKTQKNYEVGMSKIAENFQVEMAKIAGTINMGMSQLMDEKLGRIFDAAHELEMQRRDIAAQPTTTE